MQRAMSEETTESEAGWQTDTESNSIKITVPINTTANVPYQQMRSL